MKNLRLSVRTPQDGVIDRSVEAVNLPLADGWLEVLPGHSPFQARLMRGQVVFRTGGKQQHIVTLGGTVTVSRDTVSVLAGAAALNTTYEALRNELGSEVERSRAVEQEAEKHFNRVYRSLARTFRERRGRRG